MADDNLKSFTVNGVLGGLLLTCLLAFAISFMAYNNPSGLDDDGTGDIFDTSYENTVSNLQETDQDANVLLNITSNTNPEVSDLGSRDSVATSYSATGTAKESWESSKKMVAWVFSGTTGQLLLAVIGGLIGLVAYFLITKHIRQGD